MQTNRITLQINEAALMAGIIELASHLGWKHFHNLYSPGSDRGWPDLTLVSIRQQRVIWAEVKGPRGVVSDEQQQWIDDLTAAGCEAYIWWPADWPDRILDILEAK